MVSQCASFSATRVLLHTADSLNHARIRFDVHERSA
jgi:hypothetical protein